MRAKSSWLFILVVVALLFSTVLARQGQGAAAARWEYKIVAISDDAHLSEKMLNEYGSQGWELVQTQGYDRTSEGGGVYYFKRTK